MTDTQPQAQLKSFEMGLNLRDIDRTMPQARGDYLLKKVPAGYEMESEGKLVRMDVIASSPRVIAGLSLPVLKVDLHFDNHTEQDVEDFMFRFMRHFHRCQSAFKTGHLSASKTEQLNTIIFLYHQLK